MSIIGPGGVINIASGAAPAEEGVTVSPLGDKNTMQTGADGSGQHNLRAARSGTITVRLLKTSPTNAQLEQMYHVQEANPALWGQNVITLNNPGLGDNITGEQCAFKKMPELVYAVEGGMNEWAFDVIKLHQTLGSVGA